MPHTLMQLPYAKDALAPNISEETIAYHYSKHHQGYVNKLNALIEGTPFADLTLEEIIMRSDGAVFNNAAQVFNHDFYFSGLSPEQTAPSEYLVMQIEKHFGSMETFKKSFLESAASLFGSGWVWLSLNREGYLIIESRHNADTPIRHGHIPLMTCDVWEHAYYIDYRNACADYLAQWWEVIDWDVVSEKIAQTRYIEFPCDERSGAFGAEDR